MDFIKNINCKFKVGDQSVISSGEINYKIISVYELDKLTDTSTNK